MVGADNNPLISKSFDFAVRIVQMAKYLRREKREFVLSNQLLRSGTSIGANLREAVRGQSNADFLAKVYVAYKEAGESEYWIQLLRATDYLTEEQYQSILTDCTELQRMLTSTIKTLKKNQ